METNFAEMRRIRSDEVLNDTIQRIKCKCEMEVNILNIPCATHACSRAFRPVESVINQSVVAIINVFDTIAGLYVEICSGMRYKIREEIRKIRESSVMYPSEYTKAAYDLIAPYEAQRVGILYQNTVCEKVGEENENCIETTIALSFHL